MLKHKIRHQLAENIIQQSKEYLQQREQKKQKLRSQQIAQLPPETDLLGCWQVIEQTITNNDTFDTEHGFRISNFVLGDEKLYILSISPDKSFYGELIIKNRIMVEGPFAGQVIKKPLKAKIKGKILADGIIRYRYIPHFASSFRIVNGIFLMSMLPGLVDASYNSGKMQGTVQSTAESGSVRHEFEAVLIPNQIYS